MKTTALETLTPVQAPVAYAIDPTHSEVLFRVRHLLSRVGGHFRDVSGTILFDAARPDQSRVDVIIKTASIDTGVGDRDAHLKSDDFFAVATYPDLTFTSQRVVSTGEGSYTVSGPLTIRGVAKTVDLAVEFLGAAKDPWGNEKLGFEAHVAINRKDFGLTWNAALETGGVLVGDDVHITLHIQAARA